MNKNGKNFIGPSLVLMSVVLFMSTVAYMFTDGTDDVVEEYTVAEMDKEARQLIRYIPRGIDKNDYYIDTLEDNELVSDIEFETMKASNILSESKRTPYFLKPFESSLDEIDDYVEVIRLTFTYEKRKYISADFYVWKGKLFFFLGENLTLKMKPWARFLTVYDLKERTH